MKKNPYHFPGISVIIPEQRDAEDEIVAVNLGIPLPEHIPQQDKNFSMIRLIANIGLFYKSDIARHEPIKKEFDPPIEIRVGYNFADVMRCGSALENLKLAYWDQDKWVIISIPEFEYQILPPSTGQVAEAKIKTWTGDPPIGWGREPV